MLWHDLVVIAPPVPDAESPLNDLLAAMQPSLVGIQSLRVSDQAQSTVPKPSAPPDNEAARDVPFQALRNLLHLAVVAPHSLQEDATQGYIASPGSSRWRLDIGLRAPYCVAAV